jgi:hypothetical protein
MSREIRNLSTRKLRVYYDRSVKTARPANEHRPDIVMFDKTIEETYVKDVALHHSHSLYSTVTEKLRNTHIQQR